MFVVRLLELYLINASTEIMYNSWGEVLAFQPSINELLLHESVKFQFLQVLSFKDMLRQRDVLLAVQGGAAKQLEKRTAEQQKAATSGKTDKVAQLEALLDTVCSSQWSYS
jgi:hypothetical protein